LASDGSHILASVAPSDCALLRTLANQVADLASHPREEEKRKLWYRHNALLPTRPLIFCDPEGGWDEIIPPSSLQCQGEPARTWELVLRKETFWGTQMRDDRVIAPCFVIPHVYTKTDSR